jgi:TonB-dependent receptor
MSALKRLGERLAMMLGRWLGGLAWGLVLLLGASARAQQASGSLRGVIWDRDFDVPLPGAQVLLVETGQKVETSEQGHFVLSEVAPGRYTLVVSRDGYIRQVKADVVVVAGQLTDVEIRLAGDFTEMEEFVVEDVLQMGAGTEAGLLQLRLESPAFMDSISADLMRRAGASDAASALTLVSGASVAEGKSAVIRGLPDRYVSSQLNGVRLPSADEDKRSVELDQYPAPVIESIQVSKTFTPDQQGDASGGAVDVRLKSIPDQTVLQYSAQYSQNSNVQGSDWITYDGGGVNTWGDKAGDMLVQTDALDTNGSWDGAVGVEEGDAPIDNKWSFTAGGKHNLDSDVTLGGLLSLFYERDSSFHDDGVEDSLWVENPGAKLTPETTGAAGDLKTSLFDVTRSQESVQWGGLATLGLQTENHALGLTYLFTHIAEDTTTLAEDTRGKEYYFPGYDPNDPTGPGNEPSNQNIAPYLRNETLDYTERETETLQLDGRHVLENMDLGTLGSFTFGAPEFDWYVAGSSADLDQPDKRQFGSYWLAPSFNPGFPPFVPPFTSPATYYQLKPSENINYGNLQRIFKTIEEDSDQYALNLKLPFEQWSGDPGYLKLGVFDDQVERKFHQDTYTNSGEVDSFYEGDWDDYWSEAFPSEFHPLEDVQSDVDYDGELDVSAFYTMADMPLDSRWNVIGGVRWESTRISIVNSPEPEAVWLPPGQSAIAPFTEEADVDFSQDDALPSLGLQYVPTEGLTMRATWSETVARQTFKELSPIYQQEYLGGPVFIGNPGLGMSALENWDFRTDWSPEPGRLLSFSWFKKHVDDPIEYVQRVQPFSYTTAVNYPEGELDGYEFEVRQGLEGLWGRLEGLSVGANATFINSVVQISPEEIAGFQDPGIDVDMTERDMTNAPEHLYNLYLTWDVEHTGTQVSLFYTVVGDTLVAGAGESAGNFVPNVYALEYGTLNLSVAQELSERTTLTFQGKNLTNPEIEEVYRPEDGAEATKSSYTRGREFSLGVTVRF